MFTRSENWLDRALKVIPNGTGTFSKSRTNLPRGASPYYVSGTRMKGMHDVDGNTYLDFTMALTAVILGYEDSDVREAVLTHLVCCGHPITSLPHTLEVEVAELVCDMVPCAEMVRFGKNGSDATTGAVRLARAFTGRDHIVQCGYHGWHDWSIANTGRNAGIPQAVKDLTHTFIYNNIDSLHKIFDEYSDDIACVIMEPMNREFPEAGFLHDVQDLCRKHGALFILDEVITGFRFAVGGAQQLFDIKPDLACLGKAIANGYPLSALVGREEIMRRLGEDIHFSFTNASEALSLAAAKATLKKIRDQDVPAKLAALGTPLPGSGHPSWRHLTFRDMTDKTRFLQEMHKRGILCQGTINLCHTHTSSDIVQLRMALDEWQSGAWDDIPLECTPLEPLFRPR